MYISTLLFRVKRRFRFSIAFFIFALSLVACSQQPYEYSIATGEKNSVHYTVGKSIAALLQQEYHSDVKLITDSKGSLENCQRLLERKSDFALSQNDINLNNIVHTNPSEPLSATSHSEIRTVLPLYPQILFIIYDRRLQPTSLRNLIVGRKVALGSKKGGTAQLTHHLFESYGIFENEYTSVYTSYKDNTLSDSLLVSCTVTGFNNPIIADMIKHKNGKIFSLDNVSLRGQGSSVEGFCMNYPRARAFIVPKNLFGSLPEEPVLSVAVDNVLLTRSDVDVEVVKRLVATLLEQRQQLANSNPLLTSITENIDPGLLNFPLHKGVQMYLDRNEPSFFEKNAEVVSIGITIFAALYAGLNAFWRWNKQRKKDRIDEYYLHIIALDEQSAVMSDPMFRFMAIQEIEQLKKTAFDNLVREKLSADESFRIFIQLANDTIGKIEKQSGIAHHEQRPSEENG
jgi:TRAP transporter TAXI family solute receptor